MSEPSNHEGIHFDAWLPQEPPADFADLAVRAMLDKPQPARARKRRSWFGIVGLAALFVGTSTWAMWGQGQAEAKPLKAASLIPAVEVKLPEAPKPVVTKPMPPLKKVPAKQTRNWAPRKAAPAVKVKPSVKVEGIVEEGEPIFVIQPRCICENDGTICSCVD